MQATSTTTAVPPPPPPVSGGPRRRPASLQFAVFCTALIWYLCARMLARSAASGLAQRFALDDWQSLMEAVFRLFLVVCGFALLRAIEQRRTPLRLTLGLPRRSTTRAEWALGLAFGWGLAVAAILPMTLGRVLSMHLWTAPRAFELLGLSVATLAVSSLAYVLGVYGYGFQRLIEAAGPTRATLILVALSALHAARTGAPDGTPEGTRILVEMLFTLVLCLCWLRTHGLWLGWGLQFGWAVSTGVLFGLPLNGDISYSSVVDTRAGGPLWLSGGSYGPSAAAFSVVLLAVAISLLVRSTSDYAWDYTHPPIIPGGYDVTIPPPAAHVAMEAAQTAKPIDAASLVQILPATPQGMGGGSAPE